MPPPLQFETVPSDMHLTRWGHAGSRVVMVHGSAQGSPTGGERHFSAQKRLAERGWRVWVPDRPGHGRTPDPERPDDAEQDGRLVARLLDGGAHLVGHSFGACVALAAAEERPTAVRSLTLIEPAMASFAMDDPRVRRFGMSIVKVLFFSFTARNRIQRFMKLVNIPEDIGGLSSDEELQRMGRALLRMKLPNKKTLTRQLEAVRRAGIPVMVVSGGWSPAFEAISDRVATAADGQRLVIESPHHFPQQVSDAFNDALEAFMRTSEAKAG